MFKGLAIFYLLLLTVSEGIPPLPGNWPLYDLSPPPVNAWNDLVNLTALSRISLGGETCPLKDNYCSWRCGAKCTRDTDIVVCPQKKDWGLSFDDGPSNFTLTLLNYLASQKIKTTFFVLGSRVVEYPQILKQAYDAGHEIAVHTWSHAKLTTQTNEQIIAEIKWTELAIQKAIGVTPRFMRPPYGDIDDRVRSILKQLNYTPVIWDSDTKDWTSISDKQFDFNWIEGNFSDWTKIVSNQGHISLQHDLYQQTVTQVPQVLSILKNAGYNIISIANCVDRQPYQENGVSLDSSVTNVTSTIQNTSPTNSPLDNHISSANLILNHWITLNIFIQFGIIFFLYI